MDPEVLNGHFRRQLTAEKEADLARKFQDEGFPEATVRLEEYRAKEREIDERVDVVHRVTSSLYSENRKQIIPLRRFDESDNADGYIGLGAVIRTIGHRDDRGNIHTNCHIIHYVAYNSELIMNLDLKDEEPSTPPTNTMLMGQNDHEVVKHMEKSGQLAQQAKFDKELAILEAIVFPDGVPANLDVAQYPEEELEKTKIKFRDLQRSFGILKPIEEKPGI